MKLKTLSTAILLTTVPMTGVFAAAMDRSGQSISAFLQPGNYFEAGISVLDPTVEGQEAGTSATQRNISDMAGDYYFPSAALKLQPTDKFSFGILYDQPFGADAEYTGNNVFVSNGGETVLPQATLNSISQNAVTQLVTAAGAAFAPALVAVTNVTGGNPLAPTQQEVLGALQQVAAGGNATVAGGLTQLQQTQAALNATNSALGQGNTKVEVNTQNLAFVFGFQPTENWNIYAGPVYQTVKGNLSLRGQAYSLFNGYDASIKETGDLGWLAGLAFQIPEIALKASLTYRSEIEHEADTTESLSALSPALIGILQGVGVSADKLAALDESGKNKITTPQSVNLDFQTGIMENTVAFANVRWVEWSKFAIRPHQFGKIAEAVGSLPSVNRPNGFNLVEYSDDQISATVGVGRKLSEQWAGNVSVGWDSGAGNPVSTLGPTEGYWNVGLGVQFSPAPNYFIAGGVKYFMLGDAKAQTGAQAGGDEYVAKFEDNDALAYGLKIGYRF
ncbi:outer membrane protein transport protein [Acinetobacter terrae]|uniref:Long-chain fatty acid transporter n=1 Tax=Acinetobacter terrae TaxID=2731247 RepID=A0A8E4FD91_9GAMM|nr:outer membrane protein transport protein [Acinetobacter terrae]NNH38429.1 long-chain fatty acid transporter [Acinetobacter terrae]